MTGHSSNHLKRISGITDLRGGLETLGPISSLEYGEDMPEDQLAKRAQVIGSMSDYSVYQLSEATQHKQYVEC